MGVREQIAEQLATVRAKSTTVECPVCGTRYDRKPLNCAACGNTRFD